MEIVVSPSKFNSWRNGQVSKEISERVRKAQLPSAKKAAEKKRKQQSAFYFAKLLKKNKDHEGK